MRRILLKFGSSKRTDVVAKFAEQHASRAVAEARQSKQLLHDEISQIKRDELSEACRKLILNASTEALESFIGGHTGLLQIMDTLLKGVLEATGSSFGMIAEASIKAKSNHVTILAVLDANWDKSAAKAHRARL